MTSVLFSRAVGFFRGEAKTTKVNCKNNDSVAALSIKIFTTLKLICHDMKTVYCMNYEMEEVKKTFFVIYFHFESYLL